MTKIDQPKRSLIRDLARLLEISGQRSGSWIALAVLGSVILAALDTLGVAAMVPLMQLVTGSDPTEGALGVIASVVGSKELAVLIPWVAGVIAMLFVLKSAFTIGFRWWLLGRTTRVSADAATALLRRYVSSPYVLHRTRQLPEVYRNINDATSQASTVLLGVIGMISDLLMLVAVVAILFITSPLATLTAAAFFAVLLGGVQALLRKRQARIGEELSEGALQTWQFLLPALDGFREARLTTSASSFVRGFEAAKQRTAAGWRMLSMVSEIPKYLLEIGFVVAIIGISVILFTTTTAAAAITALGVFAAASLRALPTLNRVSATFAIIRSGQVGVRIVVDVAEDLDRHTTFEENARDDRMFSGDIEVHDVRFRYPDADEDILRGISTTITAYATTAFVGSSGAGKSTLLDLLLGLLDPSAGEIRCGGRLIGDDLAAWYRGLGVVPQEVFLLNDTLEANIAFGVGPELMDRDLVWESIRHAQLGELVESLPDGLDTVVGERGVRLSGGQRQRIGLARALYRRPSVLVLDEATSALDNETEHQIASTLQSLRGQMTVIVVAHRLSTVRDADKLVFMSEGSIVSEGTFENVRASTPAFARLVALGELK